MCISCRSDVSPPDCPGRRRFVTVESAVGVIPLHRSDGSFSDKDYRCLFRTGSDSDFRELLLSGFIYFLPLDLVNS
ncbi:unnamed protein product [Heligmosomoides polygyrus]|uniref:Uncharacterized protein n=1 Tax=Heligmosomoides polygyrus TaxID=6339 RepID=A0A183FPG2_HELPZ|nr:unnamed protein product [Heligmosomoides polygyrus]